MRSDTITRGPKAIVKPGLVHIVAITLLWISPVAADPDPGWWSGFGTAGLNGQGRDTVVYNDNLIVGGDFMFWGSNNPLLHIGRFDGNSWGRIADGFNSIVMALHVHDGELYAAGPFTMAGLTEVGHVARWDGWSWNAVGYLIGPWTLATYKGDLIAGDPGYSPSVVRTWDGVSWVALDPPLTGLPVTMIEFAGDLYVGGYFEYAEGNPVTDLVRWDGSHWSDFGATLTYTQPLIWGTYPVEVLSTEYDGALLVGGSFSHVNGIYANGLARWDGVNWTGLGSGLGLPAAVTDIAVHNGELIVVGGFVLPGGGSSIARWDGSSWQPLESGIALLNPLVASLSADVLNAYSGHCEHSFRPL